jgi:putative tricarboxylic transport membrane protein
MIDAILVYVSPVYLVVALLTVAATFVISAITRLPALSTFFLVSWLGLLAAFSLEDKIPGQDVIAVVFVVSVSSVGIIQAFIASALGERDDTRSTIIHGLEFKVDGGSARALGGAMSAAVIGAVLAVPIAVVVATIWDRVFASIGFIELVILTVVPLVLISAIQHGMMIKGLAAAALGLVIGSVGISVITGDVRFTFGQDVLWAGLPIPVAVVGGMILPDLVWRPSARASISRGMEAKETWGGMRDSIRVWQWSASDPRISVLVRQALFAIIAVGWGIPLIAPMMVDAAAGGPTTLLSDGGAGLGILQFTFFASLSVLVGSLLAVGMMVVGAGFLSGLSNVPRPLVVGTFAPLALLFVFISDASYVHLLAVFGLGFLGLFMRWAGWPRVPLIAGVLVMPVIEVNLDSVINLQGVGGTFARPSMIFALLLIAGVLMPTGDSPAQRPPRRRHPLWRT